MAAISKVRIANMALSNIGAKSTIETFVEDSAEAQEIDLWYDYSRLQTLMAADWSFARRRLTLTTHTEDPPGTWGFRYVYPADCISFRHIQHPSGQQADAIPFEIEIDATLQKKSILTDLDDAIGVYTFDLETVDLFSPMFVDMLSFALASHIAFALTGSLELRKEMGGTFSEMRRVAPADNANEQVGRSPREASWIRDR